jgi:HEAT repeat protein
LLVDAGANVARDPIRALMLSLAPSKLPPLLPWLAHVDAVLGSEVGIELMRRYPDDADIVAAALLVVRDPAVLPELTIFADSANAEVRQNLAVGYGQLGGIAETDVLMRLMCDPVWWVRYRAAQSLIQLKGMTEAGIDAVRARLTDNYALDMLDHVQAEAKIK